ncbi:lipocalin family protein [uncultured Winogradskyella sp.]|uniref:lipocalin family protein n=1 Tax=uncultured Winogradskyella sp. TaxID=395353 RepID=UPI0030DB6D45|tara:strand:- start:272 stop:691 length:420 start_codon:yes stop_codon:yes gene_type:complete
MRKLTVLLCLLIFSCSKNPELYIPHIEGYWEIENVSFYNGDQKDYKYNETIDYISLNDSLKGFRKKLKPGLNDTYFTSADAEAISVKIEDDSLRIYYSTPYAKWKETILSATPQQLIIINKNKAVYTYKKYTPIILDIE